MRLEVEHTKPVNWCDLFLAGLSAGTLLSTPRFASTFAQESPKYWAVTILLGETVGLALFLFVMYRKQQRGNL